MTRTPYGGSPADVITHKDTDGDLQVTTSTLTAWDADAGGDQLTDLLDALGSSATVVTPDILGRVLFKGPDGYTGAIWLEDEFENRWRIEPADLATRTGGVSKVNGSVGEVDLDLDDIDDTDTRVAMLPVERTKLDGIEEEATKNSSDEDLLAARPSDEVLTDMDASGGTEGLYMRRGADGVGRWAVPDAPVDPTEDFDISDANDFADDTPAAGNVVVNDGTIWTPASGALACFILSTGQAIPPGALPGVYFRRAATSIVKTHVVEGTSGAAVTAADTGYTSMGGATANYTNAAALVGSTSMRVVAGNFGYGVDGPGLAMDTVVVKRRIRPNSTPTGVVNFAQMLNSAGTGIAQLQRDTSGVIKLKDGAGTTRATTTATLDPNTWYIYEWKVGGGLQSFRLFTSTGTLIEEILDKPCTAGQIDSTKNGIYLNANGGMDFDNAALAADWLGATG